jgi:hypothetical protein
MNQEEIAKLDEVMLKIVDCYNKMTKFLKRFDNIIEIDTQMRNQRKNVYYCNCKNTKALKVAMDDLLSRMEIYALELCKQPGDEKAYSNLENVRNLARKVQEVYNMWVWPFDEES